MIPEDKTLAAIQAHAAEVYPQECCGLIVETAGCLSVVRSKNMAPDPYRTFMVDPALFLQYEARTKAVYHSHPDRGAKPSEADKASCSAVGRPFLILSWPSGNMVSILPEKHEAQLEGRQFVYGVFDCLAIVEDFYRQEYAIEVPNYGRPPFGWWMEDVDYIGQRYSKMGFIEAQEPEHGDVIVMQMGGARVPNHVGVYLEGGLLLHHALHMLSRKDVYGSRGGYWRKHTVRVLRHENNSHPAR